MSIASISRKPTEVQYLQWTGENQDELLAFAGESIVLGEAGTPVIESMGERGFLMEGDIFMKDAKGNLDIVGPAEFIKSFAVESIEGLQASLEKHWNKAEREAASSADWAVPAKKKLRIDDAKHVRLAWDMVSRTGGLSDEERAQARRRILAKAKKLGVDTTKWTTESISTEDIDAEIVVMDAEAASVPGAVDVFSTLFTHCSEEASELIRGFCKAQRYGLDNFCPQLNSSSREGIERELAELQACLLILNEELASAGIAPIEVSPERLEAAKVARLAVLEAEHNLGRFTTGSEG